MKFITDNEKDRQQVLKIIDTITPYVVDIKPLATYTDKQRGALHVWCRQCAEVLNEAGITCTILHPFTKQEIEMPWTMELFKENIYKFILKAMTGKTSTEDQSTVEPSDVALVIAKRYAENGLQCPPWPSLR